jgi:hypothetical protein
MTFSSYCATTAVTPRISMTWTCAPGSMTSSSSYGRARQIELDAALVGGDALDDGRGAPDQRGRAGAQCGGLAPVRARDGAQGAEQDDRGDQEGGEAECSPGADGAEQGCEERAAGEGSQEQACGGDLPDPEDRRRNHPEHPVVHVDQMLDP